MKNKNGLTRSKRKYRHWLPAVALSREIEKGYQFFWRKRHIDEPRCSLRLHTHILT